MTDTQPETRAQPTEDDVVRGAAGMPDPPAAAAEGEIPSLEDLEEAMRDVVDPELGINVVDLGLVYDIRVDESRIATVDMTLTSAACPLTDVIEDQTRSALVSAPGGGLVNDVKINYQRIGVEFGGGCTTGTPGCIPGPAEIGSALANITFPVALGLTKGVSLATIGPATNLPQPAPRSG